MPSVLFVCAANRCRSPYAAAKFRAGMSELSGLEIFVNSAGTNATSGQDWCPISVSKGAEYRAVHKSSEDIKNIDLETYDLILTSGLVQRAIILRNMPRIRAKLFTMREAAIQVEWLKKPGGALDVASGGGLSKNLNFGLERVSPLPTTYLNRWDWLVDEMNQWRGFVEEMPTTKGELDIPDPHDSQRNIHAKVFAQIDQVVNRLSSGISMILNH